MKHARFIPAARLEFLAEIAYHNEAQPGLGGDPEPRRINLPVLKQADIDSLIAPLLGDKAREALRFSGKCELAHDVQGLGVFNVKVAPGETVIVAPPAPPKTPTGDKKPGFFRKLLGGG